MVAWDATERRASNTVERRIPTTSFDQDYFFVMALAKFREKHPAFVAIPFWKFPAKHKADVQEAGEILKARADAEVPALA